jgi:hypothetical protein
MGEGHDPSGSRQEPGFRRGVRIGEGESDGTGGCILRGANVRNRRGNPGRTGRSDEEQRCRGLRIEASKRIERRERGSKMISGAGSYSENEPKGRRGCDLT